MTLVEAVRSGLRARADLGVAGVAGADDADRAVGALGLERWPDEPLPGRLYGAYFDGVIQLDSRLLPGTRLFALAHELGHAAMGHRQGAYRARLPSGGPEPSEAEEEAQVWAFAFLLGEPARTHDGLDAQLHAGFDAGLPLGFLFGCASLFGAALAAL